MSKGETRIHEGVNVRSVPRYGHGPQLFRQQMLGEDPWFSNELGMFKRARLQENIQAKLNVNAPGDSYEQEADAAADAVVRGGSFQIQRNISGLSRSGGEGGFEVGSGFQSRLQSRKGGGQGLPAHIQRSFSQSLGQDLSGVRVHTDSAADAMSRSISAKAFTHGRDIFFRQGAYDPGSSQGKHLLAHEVSHTIQQGAGPGPLQRADETRKYTLEYDKIIKANQRRWKAGIRNIKPFNHLGIDPYEEPVAFANHTYEFQQAVLKNGYTNPALKASGYFDHNSLAYMTTFAEHAIKPEYDGDFTSWGFDEPMLKALGNRMKKETGEGELISSWFRGIWQFTLTNKYVFYTIRKGEKGEHVKRLQLALEELNYSLPIWGADGKFGNETRNALKLFQLDNGIPEKMAKGVLDHKTLRLLDMKMADKVFQPNFGAGGEPAYQFKVPVVAYLTRSEFTHKALKHIFKINDAEASSLISQGWHIDNYTEVNEKHIKNGYKVVAIRISLYRSIKTEAGSIRSGGKGKTYSLSEYQELAVELSDFSEIYKIDERLAQIQKDLLALYLISSSSTTAVTRIVALTAEKEKLIKKKEQALAKLGVTEKVYEEKKSAYKHLFGQFAASIALKMLEENKTSAKIEKGRLGTAGQVGQTRKVIERLDVLYTKADEEFWLGVCKELGLDASKIRSEADFLQSYQFNNFMMIRMALLYDYHPTKMPETFPNTNFKKAKEYEMQAGGILQTEAPKNPILAFPGLELRAKRKELLKLDDAKLGERLLNLITDKDKGILKMIEKTQQAIRNDYKIVYSMAPVIARAKLELGVINNSIQDKLIKEAIKEYEDAKFWRDIGLAALGLVLGLVALASGPIGWAALAGSIVVGGIDAYIQYQEISTARNAADTAMDPTRALQDVKPSWFWFYFSLATIGLDIVQGAKVIKTVVKGAKFFKAGTQLAEELGQALAKERKLVQEALEAAQKAAKPNAQEIARLTKELQFLDDAIRHVESGDLARHFNIFRHIAENPDAVISLSKAMSNDGVKAALLSIEKLATAGKLSEAAFAKSIQHFAGPGRNFLRDLPEALEVAQKAGLSKKKELFEQFLGDSRLQQAVLDHASDPGMLGRHWDEWVRAGRPGLFSKFLENKGIRLSLEKYTSIADELGAGFASLAPAIKNRQLLRHGHPKLLDAFDNKTLPPKVQAALEKVLAKDLVGTTDNLSRAMGRVEAELSRAIGGNVDSFTELSAVLRHVNDPAVRKAAYQTMKALHADNAFVALLGKYGDDIAKASTRYDDVMDDLIRIGPVNEETLKTLIGNRGLRDALIENPEVIAAMKRCASPCFPPGATPVQVRRIHDGIRELQKTHPNFDMTRLNEYIYQNRGAGLDQAIKDFAKDPTVILQNVYKFTPHAPAAWSSVPDIASKISRAVANGISGKQLEAIMANAARHGANGSDFMDELIKASARTKAKEMRRWGELLEGLEKGSTETFESAQSLMKWVAKESSAISKVDYILTKLEWEDLNIIRKNLGDPPGDTLNKYLKAHYTKASPPSTITHQLAFDFIGNLKKLKADTNFQKHLFEGHINTGPRATGGHFFDSIAAGKIRIDTPPPPTYVGTELRKAKVSILDPSSGAFVQKNALSTFFPNTWTKDKIMREIAMVWSNPANKVHDRLFRGLASDGVTRLEVRLTGPLSSLRPDTAFPLF